MRRTIPKRPTSAVRTDAESSDMVRPVQVQDYFSVNAYFWIDENTGHGFLIDPGAQADWLLRIVDMEGWTIEKILLTHGHFDHTGAVMAVSRALDCPFYIHHAGKDFLTDISLNLSIYCDRNVVLSGAHFLQDGDVISLEANPRKRLEVIHTPGHTPDSAVYYSVEEKTAFVGDTIFKGGPGSTQYPGGNPAQLRDSLEKILSLPPETILYSGHSAPTTVGREYAFYLR